MFKYIRNESGQAMVFVALFLVVLMGFAALAVDVGAMTVQRSKLQNAADAAALAGALDYANAESTATQYARLNGVDSTIAGTTIEVDTHTIVGGTEGAYENVYSEDELIELESEIKNAIEGKSDSVIIDYAKDNYVDISSYLDDTGDMFISGTVALKTKEEIKEEIREELMQIPNSLIVTYAEDLNITIKPYTSGSNPPVIKNDSDKLSIINLMLNTDDYKNEINDRYNNQEIPADYKTAAIQYIIESRMLELRNDKTFVGERHGNSNRVRVTNTEKVNYTFARLLGFTDSIMTVTAVAENAAWAGDALPFINLDSVESYAKGDLFEAWNKTGPGIKERISNKDLIINDDSIKVKVDDGFIIYKMGKDLSKIQDPLKKIAVEGNTVYVYSIIESQIENYKDILQTNNGYNIPMEHIELLECEVMNNWDGTGADIISLKFINRYPYNSATNSFETPSGEKPGGSVRLVE
ncbi:MAG TPA: hypothetical protein DC024_13910 [Clostridiales bacterium]|jgi:hypothetical protein|nr:hypothetical protein [Clostridiales bacterium]